MVAAQVESAMAANVAEANVHVHAKTIIVVAAVNFVFFSQLIAITGSGLLAQPITQLLGGSDQTVWPSSVINILTVALSPSISQAADYWGRKWLLVTFTMFGFAGSMIVSRADNIGTVIVGFTVMGLCYGAQPLLYAVVSEVLPRKHRPFAQAAMNMSSGVGAFIGLMMGGSLLRHGNLENYRIYWYVVAAIFAVAAAACAILYNPPVRELQISLTMSEKLRKLDWIGYFLSTPGLVLFCVALSWSRNPYPWTNARILATFIIGVLLILGFVVYEWRFKKDGVLHHRLFQNRNFPISLVCIFVEGLAFFACNAYYAQEVSVFTSANLFTSAFHFGIVFLTAIPCALLFGAYSAWRKEVRSIIVLGFLLLLIFYIVMATRTPSSPKTALWGYPVLAGAGLGAVLPTILVVAQLSTPPDLISVTSGLVIATRGFGSAVGLAINNAVFNDALKSNIPSKIAAATLPLGLPASSLEMLIGALTAGDQSALQKVPGATPQILGAAGTALTEAYGVGFRDAWIASGCFCFVAVIASLFLFDPRSEFSAHIDAPAEAQLIVVQKRAEAEDGVDIPIEIEDSEKQA